MARKVSYFKLGLLVLVCGAIGLSAAVWLGLSHYFEKTRPYVTYFGESVKGLQTDAVVNYRGVAVGRVTYIGLAPDGRLIEVIMGLMPEFEIDHTLSIRLREQGLTGMRYLEIDTAPPNIKELTPAISFTPTHPLIPASPSDMEVIRTALETLYTKMLSIDVVGVADNWKQAAKSINDLLASEQISDSLKSVREGASQLEALMTKLNGSVDGKELQATFKSLKDATHQAASVMDQLAGAKGSKEGGAKDISAILSALRKSSEALAQQLEAIPPNSFANASKDMNRMFESGANSFGDWSKQVEDSLVVLQQSLRQVSALIGQLTGLVQTFKEQPNRILFNQDEPDPFQRR